MKIVDCEPGNETEIIDSEPGNKNMNKSSIVSQVMKIWNRNRQLRARLCKTEEMKIVNYEPGIKNMKYKLSIESQVMKHWRNSEIVDTPLI